VTLAEAREGARRMRDKDKMRGQRRGTNTKPNANEAEKERQPKRQRRRQGRRAAQVLRPVPKEEADNPSGPEG